jgi:hypothetical protein
MVLYNISSSVYIDYFTFNPNLNTNLLSYVQNIVNGVQTINYYYLTLNGNYYAYT